MSPKEEKQDFTKAGKVHRGMSVFPVRDFRTYKEALTGGVIHTQQKGTNRLTGVDKSHNDINLTARQSVQLSPVGPISSSGLQLLDIPVNLVANFPVRGVRGGVGHVSSSFVAGREMTFESLSNESKLQEVHVDDVVELAR
ncbi:hypothetical protein V6N12_066723 [Hibiscus sabdariffa]|uniref:Uncharacterized protein n=1 Tax=Hibiscus sabdariffa TaxID=183260 RepID=A0ABR2BFI9_9ROSI